MALLCILIYPELKKSPEDDQIEKHLLRGQDGVGAEHGCWIQATWD